MASFLCSSHSLLVLCCATPIFSWLSSTRQAAPIPTATNNKHVEFQALGGRSDPSQLPLTLLPCSTFSARTTSQRKCGSR